MKGKIVMDPKYMPYARMVFHQLRKYGYAVVVFNPVELGNLNPQDLEDALVLEGNLMIEAQEEKDGKG